MTQPRQPPRLTFTTKLAVSLSVASLILLFGLQIVYAPKNNNTTSSSLHEDGSSLLSFSHRQLEEQQDDAAAAGNDDDAANPTDYNSYSCDHLYDVTPDPGDAQCLFAKTCNDGDGVWLPFVFCSYKFSTKLITSLLSPIILLWMVLLFRMLGSTAEEYFSPALEMFSVKLGLRELSLVLYKDSFFEYMTTTFLTYLYLSLIHLAPRFAGVTLLALGNGAADVSATISAISSNPQEGYLLSLGALSGAAMFIGGVVSALVIITAQGVPCRGALLRDVMALLVTVVVVWMELRTGRVGSDTITLFLSMYFTFVCVVLVADIYHRRVVLPRQRVLAQEEEYERQMQEGRMQHDEMKRSYGLSSFMVALSNYDLNAGEQESGWGGGVDSNVLAQDQPIMLHGDHGVLAHAHGAHHMSANGSSQATDGYSVLEDAIDRVCIGSDMTGRAKSWNEAYLEGKAELKEHAESVWEDIVWNGDVHVVDKFLLLCELPVTAIRKITVPVPCEGFYVRGLVALSLAISPTWFAFYLYRSHGVNVLSGGMRVYFFVVTTIICLFAACVLRFSPGGQGQMPLSFSGPIALYGFVIAATWIDTIADSLVSLLNFIGIILNIPSSVLGLTLLAWGNSMSDLSANVTMARKGLANMAVTACFAGPVFNILVGLGLGFSSLAAQTGQKGREVSLQSSVLTGFVFIIANCVLILVAGLVFGKGRVVKQYGYVSLVLYAAYVTTSIYKQFSG